MGALKTPAEVVAIFEALSRQHPNADTELHYHNAFELLAATILSAQSTDARVNLVTPALFARYPDARSLAAADPADVEALVQSTGFFRQKTRALIGMAAALVERHGGEVPRTMEALTQLPGVGRKTANVVLGHALGIPGFAVDRHVLRVAGRIGVTDSDDPERVEQQLTGALPPLWWTRASDTLILHGRRVCKPVPQCERCVITGRCAFRLASGRPATARAGRAAAPARRRAAAAGTRAGTRRPQGSR